MRPRVGVLAVQGNFREHAAMLRRLGAEPVEELNTVFACLKG